MQQELKKQNMEENKKTLNNKWSLLGLDTFSDEYYPLDGEYLTEMEAKLAAIKRLFELEESQPSKTSGGQGPCGIQDRVYIIRPDGTRYRYCGE